MGVELDKKITKLLKKGQRQFDKTATKVAKHSRTFVWSRLDHIRMAKKNVIIWLCLMLLLIIASLAQAFIYNQQIISWAPTKGGTYAEGVVDKLTTVSPLYAKTDTEKAASQLIYASLLYYDTANKLHGELASSWSVDNSGQVWTVKLRDNIHWSDGHPITSDDVAFTLGLMKDPLINTTLSTAWNTINIEAPDSKTVLFKLASPLTSFDSALNFGILPKHILKDKKPIEISTMFSQSPQKIVSSGPLQISNIEKNKENSTWHFIPNQRYPGNKPDLNDFSIRTYSTNEALIDGLKRGEINAISNAKISDIKSLQANFNTKQIKTSNGVFVLFNNDHDIIKENSVREALRLGLNRDHIRQDIVKQAPGFNPPTRLESPIATGVYDSVDNLSQPNFDPKAASDLLDQAGWKIAKNDTYRYKNDTKLVINIVTIAGTNYESIAKLVAQDWEKIGVKSQIKIVDPKEAQQNFLVPRNYDVLIYQMHLGADPDMFAYWSSSQATSTGLNLANYKSRRAEIALSAGRTNTNPEARQGRYLSFVKQWLADNPAIALYQPSLIYVTDPSITTFHQGDSVIDASNRFANISSWSAKLAPVVTTP